MASAIHNFFIEQGSSFEIVFEYLDETGSPIIISNSDCVKLKFKTNTDEYAVWRNGPLVDGAGLLTFSNDPTLSGNQIKWKLPATITKTYNFDTASYVLELVIGGSPEISVIKLATGQIGLIKDLFLTECVEDPSLKTCKDCTQITITDSTISISPNKTPTPTPSPQPIDPTITPTPTPSSPYSVQENLCDYVCRGLDIFGQIYTGSGINILDANIVNGSGLIQNSYSSINILNTGIATNIEVYIDTLVHENPSDLTLLLTPPSGNSVLLSNRNKIKDYSVSSGLSFAFSNKALPGIYLYNKPVNNNDLYVNILKNSGISLPEPYNNTYSYSFEHLLNNKVNGNWTLNILDNDPGGTGYINNWNLVITYLPPEEYDENI